MTASAGNLSFVTLQAIVSSAISFTANNQILGTGLMVDVKAGYDIDVSGSTSNDGAYTVDSNNDNRIITEETTIVNEAAGATIVLSLSGTVKDGPGRLSHVFAQAVVGGGTRWRLRDGGASGTILFDVDVAAAGSFGQPFPVQFNTSLYVEHVVGAGRISLLFE